MKVKYTIVFEVDEIKDPDSFDMDAIGVDLVTHGETGMDTTNKRVVAVSCHAVMIKDIKWS